jgi:NADH-quinone oxidoreductase subunit F
MTPTEVGKEVAASGLQGRGGAAFPTGRKWSVIQLDDGQPHYLCANADEGEPGTFKDRWILENSPHQLIESMMIAAYALQVRHAFVYMRGEFSGPYRRLQDALACWAATSPATSSSTAAPAAMSAARPRR